MFGRILTAILSRKTKLVSPMGLCIKKNTKQKTNKFFKMLFNGFLHRKFPIVQTVQRQPIQPINF